MGYGVQSIGRWTAFTPTITGFSVQPTGIDAGSIMAGPKLGHYRWEMASAGGTSNAASFTMTMPFLARSITRYLVMGLNSGVYTALEAYTAAGSNVISFFTLAGGNVGATLAKGSWGMITVEIQ